MNTELYILAYRRFVTDFMERFIEKLIVAQQVNKLSSFYRTKIQPPLCSL